MIRPRRHHRFATAANILPGIAALMILMSIGAAAERAGEEPITPLAPARL